MRRSLVRSARIVREAWASALSQPVSSIVSIVIIAGMCASVLLTTGRTVGAEDAVLASFDTAGTRTIVVRAQPDSGLDSRVLDRLDRLTGIESAIAFGPVRDVRNVAFPDGTAVPLREVWGAVAGGLLSDDSPPVAHTAWASASALDSLGMPDSVGGIIDNEGSDYAVVGKATVPNNLNFLEPLVFAPRDTETTGAVSVLVVVAERPDLVSAVAAATLSLVAVEDPTQIQIATSEAIASLRGLVEGQLGSYGRSLVIVIFGISAVFVAAILYGFTMLRRKDYGRRRALGATRSLIVALVIAQMALLSIAGSAIGITVTLISLRVIGDPIPDADFTLAIAILACTVGMASALVPAVVAARRDPIRELRVP